MRAPFRAPRFKTLGAFAFWSALFALLLAGCASLPEVPYTVAAPKKAPTIVTSKGTMSPRQATALVDRLDQQAGDTELLERHIAWEEAVAGTPLTAGNKVTLLVDGPATYQAMFRAIDQAKSNIHLESYIFEDDELGHKLAEMLMAKQREGVQVAIIHDSVGTLRTPREFFKQLDDAGIQTLEYNPVNPLYLRGKWAINNRDHRKILIVDGKIAFTGGVNISGIYSKSSFMSKGSAPMSKGSVPGDKSSLPWRDTHIEMDGPVAAEFQKLFLDTWQRQQGAPLQGSDFFPKIAPQGNELVRAIGSRSHSGDYTIFRTFLSVINHAERSIHITNAYFVPDAQVLNALSDAAKRGVDVKILLPSVTDSGPVFFAGRSNYATLLAAGVKIYERKDALLHSKTMVVDGVWSTIGSTNFDVRSFLHNDEANAVIIGKSFADKLEQLFQRDLGESRQVTLESWKRRPMFDRVKEWGSRLFEYWL